MKTSFYFLFLIVILSSSCQQEEDNNCEEPVACTEIFVTIDLEVTNQAGEAVELDNAYTFIDSRSKIEFEITDQMRSSGIYPVANDLNITEFDFEGTIVIFVGEKDGKNVVEHQMTIGKDCCHIQLVEGEAEIQIEN
jgi:hypothetical protein